MEGQGGSSSVIYFFAYMELWAAARKPYASVAVPPLLSGFLAKCHLPRVSRQPANGGCATSHLLKWGSSK